MASFTCVHPLLLFLCSVLLFPTTTTSSESNKVTVDVYYETLCPDSEDFIVKDLIKLFESGLISIVDLKLYPYGNAKLGSNNTIYCQVSLSLLLLSVSYRDIGYIINIIDNIAINCPNIA